MARPHTTAGVTNISRASAIDITFAEPDAYSRQQHRDSDDFSYVTSVVYQPTVDLDRMLALAAEADIVVKHSGIGVDDATLERRVLECSPQQHGLLLGCRRARNARAHARRPRTTHSATTYPAMTPC